MIEHPHGVRISDEALAYDALQYADQYSNNG
jgi:hypothetical protein